MGTGKTVAPAVKTEVDKFDCPILKRLVLKPFVRFTYFPRFKYFWFKNFSDTDERIRNAHQCFDIADKTGWQNVFAAMQKYDVLSKDFFENPLKFTGNVKGQLLSL